MLPYLPRRKQPHIPATQSCFTVVDKFYPLPSALSPPARSPASRSLPTHLTRAAPVQSTTTSLSIFFNHEPKNNLIFKNANSLPVTFSCFWHHCFWALSQVCGLLHVHPEGSPKHHRFHTETMARRWHQLFFLIFKDEKHHRKQNWIKSVPYSFQPI